MKQINKLKCAIYARKSTDEGLDGQFNSLDSQRMFCAKYIDVQQHEGWVALESTYEDGGCSGKNLERPALKRLVADIKAKLIDVVVVYKIDRLSRSMLDFLNMLKLFEEHNVAFVSVTEQFSTSNYVGKLMLNIMMSFSEYERDIIRARTKDKIAASKKQGIWMGGNVPYGYESVDKKLVIRECDAEVVRFIFAEFIAKRSMKRVLEALQRKGTSKAFNLSSLYSMIANTIYIGKIKHEGALYDGEHQGILSLDVWNKVQSIIKVSPRSRGAETKRKIPATLLGLLKCSGCGSSMTATHTKKASGKVYRYYVGSHHQKGKCQGCPIKQVSASEIETVVLVRLQQLLQSPELIMDVWRNMHKGEQGRGEQHNMGYISENTIKQALANLASIWVELFPEEQTRLLRLIIDKVIVHQDQLELKIRGEGLYLLANEFECGDSMPTEMAV